MIYFCLVIFAITFVSYLPLYKKPLYNDDGNFLHAAKFKKCKNPNFKNIHYNTREINPGSIEDILSVLFRLFRTDSLIFFRTVQITWLSLINASLFYYIKLSADNYPAAFIASFLCLVLMQYPKLNFYILLGETYYILPFLGINILLKLCNGDFNSLYIFTAGILGGWMLLIKITSLPLVLFYVSVFAFQTSLYGSLFYTAGIFSSFLIANLYLLFTNSRHAVIFFNKFYWSPLIDKIKLIFKKDKEGITEYIANNHSLKSGALAGLKYSNTNFLIENFMPWILAGIPAVIFGFVYLDFDIFIHVINFLLCILILRIQNFYFITKYNVIIFMLLILDSSFFGKYLLITGSAQLNLIIAFMILTANFYLIREMFTQYKKENINRIIGFKHFGSVLKICKEAGEYINKSETNPAERMIVWGNLPNTYIYAGLMPVLQNYMFMYPGRMERSDGNQDVLYQTSKKFIPKWIMGANYFMRDNWTIDYFSVKTGIPYQKAISYNVKTGNKIVRHNSGKKFEFPLYARDDKLYRQILLAQIMSEDDSDIKGMKKHYENYDEYYRSMTFCPEIKSEISEKIEKYGVKGFYKEKVNTYYSDDETLLFATELLGKNIDDKTASIDSKMKDAEGNILAELLYMKAFCLIQKELFAEAKELLKKSINLNGENFRPYLDLGEIHFGEGNIEDAFQSFINAVNINHLSAEAYNNIGFIHFSLNNIKEAEKFLKKAIELKPDYKEAIENLNYILGKQNLD
ncbi:MAG: hypothetical protein CSB55_01415 [Candidatus Cloacimonadota bacterium]|nr:MAG: hypothetical protein CSB55_01415 [Candidatus Cloacimonadota bacterium]